MPRSACRHPQPLIRLLDATLCLSLACAAPGHAAQTGTATAAHPLDATGLHEPVQLGALGLAQAGDNPAYARPDFDDSNWLAVNDTTRVADYFPHTHSNVVWRRIHIRVAPGQTDSAVLAYAPSPAFEVFVNGQKLMENGRIDPYVPSTVSAPLLVSIPEAQLRAGSLVIAIRARATASWWQSPAPAFDSSLLILGDERALRNQAWLDILGENIAWLLENLLGIGVAVVALALFLAQRRQVEYLWIFVLGGSLLPQVCLYSVAYFYNLPADWMIAGQLMNFVDSIAYLLLVQAFMRKPFSWVLWPSVAAASLIFSVANMMASFYGSISIVSMRIAQLPFYAILDLLVPLLLIRQGRRGNREAGLLLIPVLLLATWAYATYGLVLLEQIPALRPAGVAGENLINNLQIGIFHFSLSDPGSICFWFSLAIIMVLRSTRMSRQQALLDSELAAAREIQQLLLPERVEPVAGFAVESVYEPAQQVGGDFFQILPAGQDGLLVVIGDVAGKGLPAAMLVSVLVGSIRTAAEDTHDPALILRKLNDRLLGRTRGGFSTALAAHIAADGLVFLVNAGHLPPYLDGQEVDLPAALPLGVESGAQYEATRFRLAPGSRLTFYSDGVVEARNQQGELFGFDRGKALSTQPAAAIVEAAKNFGQQDDITVVAIQRTGQVATAA